MAPPVDEIETAPRGLPTVGAGPHLSLLDEAGDVTQVIPIARDRSTLTVDGLGVQLSRHLIGGDGVEVALSEGGMTLEPVGAPRALYVFLTEPTQLKDGDVVMLGAQVIRYRVLADPDATYFGASNALRSGHGVQPKDVAILEQLVPSGRVRDTVHLFAGRKVIVGRTTGDWIINYDTTVSGTHAEFSCDASGGVTVRDLGSRNGVALAVRKGRTLKEGDRIAYDGHVMRIELS
jgi:pSer/pThr/pTyr-binding forkhead associated (FHA) protein